MIINTFSDLLVHAKKLVHRKKLDEVITTLAIEVDKQFFMSKLECVVLMNGAYQLTSDLSKLLTVPSMMNFQRVSRYQNDRPTGEISSIDIKLLSNDNRPVLVIDDIFDEGITLYNVVNSLTIENPTREIYSLVLLNKDKERSISYLPDFIGLTIKDVYVFGYGMDLSEKWRHLPEIWVVNE